MRITKIRSGGQTGVDRGALSAAKDFGISIGGWCPKGGWAEDYPKPPGVRVIFPELRETPSSDVDQRTSWNVRDSDATLIFSPKGIKSRGTALTQKFCVDYKKPYLILPTIDLKTVNFWLSNLGDNIELNVAGPRLSEFASGYNDAYYIVKQILLNSEVGIRTL
jgi:hypothetical protein